MTSRRIFLGASVAAGLSLSFPKSLRSLYTPARGAIWAPLLDPLTGETLITILHTNDTHSQIYPILENEQTYAGKGRVARRGTLAKRVRKENPKKLMIHAGDVCPV